MAKVFNGRRPQNLRRTVGTLLSYLGRHRWLLVLVGVLSALSAAASLLGTYMIKPIVNRFVTQADPAGLAVGVGVTACIYGVGVLSTLGYTQIMVRAAQKVLCDIRRDLYTKLQRLPLDFFDRRPKGDLMSLFTNDVDTISDALNNSFAMLIQSLVQVVGTLLLLFLLSWRLSLAVVVGYGVMALYIRHATTRSKQYYQRQQTCLGELDGYVEEMMAGQRVVKVFGHEAANLAGFAGRNEKLRQEGTGAQGYAATMIPAVVSISYLMYAFIAVLGGILILEGQSDVGSLTSYLVFVRQSAMPINQLTQQGNFLLAALAGAERVFQVMAQPPETDEGTVVLAQGEGGPVWMDRARPEAGPVPVRGAVRFENVCFGYSAHKPILTDLNLEARPGQKIALVGSTGAGKTTIISLVSRFYNVTGGRITLDGIDLRRIALGDLRRCMGVVLQDTHLFTGTVADNIRFGRPDATDAQVEAAARVANAHSFICRLPQGYDTMVTGDGANLSQGQRQLLAIARAAAADPPVLILDEATSSIDTRTEALIEQGMDRLMEGRTVFVIAHRLSTVRNADIILVLEQGRVVEQGNHQQLLDLHGMYYRLYHGMFQLT